jgi:MoaA/NifB/PqqE/SkfB family radical SAM enzyme
VHSRHAKRLKPFIWDNVTLPEARLSALLKCYGPYAIHTTFYNYGEPLLNSNTPKFIRLAKKYLMRTTLSTNLSLSRFDAEAYVDSGLDFMVLSIDGATQSVYERFRKQGNLELVYRNIQTLVEAKLRLGKRTPVIAWQYLAFQHNQQEIPLAIETAQRLGVNQFIIGRPYDVSWDDSAIEAADVTPVTLEFDPENEEAMAANWNPFPADLDGSTIEREFDARWISQAWRTREDRMKAARSTSTCNWLYKNVVMDGGGRVLPCCAAPRPDIDLVYSNFDGKIDSDPFNSEKHRLARLSFADRKTYQCKRKAIGLERDPHCANCDWFEDQEKAVIDGTQIRQYLKAAGNGLFDSASVEILSSW